MARLVSDTRANGKLDTWKLVSYFYFFLGEWRGEQMKHGINVIYVEFYVNLWTTIYKRINGINFQGIS